MPRPSQITFALLLAACGPSADDAAPRVPAAPSATAPTTPAREVTPPPAPNVPGCAAGYARPFTPSPEDLGAASAALVVHRRGDFVEAVGAFSALVERAPGYGSARFNLACAQARAGQLDEARATLDRLFCEDLPTNLPRALADDDLAPLRADIEALGARWATRYREASAGGVALVAFGETRVEGEYESALHWAQPGFWNDPRFVPAGPRQQGRPTDYEPPMYPSFVTDDRVVQVETISSHAEVDFLPPLRVTERELFTGVERSSRRFDESQSEFYRVRIGVREGQSWVQFDSVGDPSELRTVALTTGAVVRNPPAESAAIEFGMSRWEPIDAPTPIQVSRRANSISFGSQTIDLDGAHRGMSRSRIIAHGEVAVIHSFQVGNCGSPDRYALEAVDTRTGTSLWNEHGEGQRLVHFQDGRLWMQSEDALFAFPDARQAERTELPSGLGLSSTFVAFNPMC